MQIEVTLLLLLVAQIASSPNRFGSKGKNPTTLNKSSRPKFTNPTIPVVKEEVIVPSPKNYAVQTILGQNIINCRPFSIDIPKTFEFLGSFKSYKAIPIFPSPEIAFIGRSNVGKSSLLNCLTGLHKNIAVESKTPGRTQSINIFACRDRQGDICNFVDLPGYGFAKMSKTEQAEVATFILDYLEKRTSLRLAVLLVDIRREPQESDLSTLKLMDDIGVPVVVVATKVDKLKPHEVCKALEALAAGLGVAHIEPFSAVTGQGRRELWRLIKDGIVGTLQEENLDEGDLQPGSEEDGDDDLQRP